MFRTAIIPKMLMFCLGMIICIAAVLGPYQLGSADPSTNPVVNAGFEQPVVGGAIPGWKQTYGVGVTTLTYGVTSAAKASGAYSIRLDDASPTASLGIDSDKFPVVAGTAYSASAMFQVERGPLSIYLQFFNAAGVRVATSTASVDPSTGFVKGSVSGIAPADAVTASVLLYSASTAQGAGYIDDVTVEVIEIGTFENLGQPITNFINQDAALGRESGKEVAYTVVKGANDSTVFAVIDVDTAKVVKTIPMPGVTG
ncbi:MAG: hypothetical protein K0R28_2662, partial [Paenibacillus sp.]|nr:hypothetical protein [Paenibacillus sp.]